MFHLKKIFVDGVISVFFLILFIVSCSPTSSSSSSSGVPPSVREAEVQLRSTLGEGITSSGSGSQSDPFKILIDESVSLERPSLALSELFSNVASVAEGQSKVGTARLDITGLTVEPGLGSKLSIELKASNNEKKYATLYFQDSARLTNAVQSGGAVLDSVARGGVAKAVEVVVTVYKEEVEDESWNVALDSLFDYNEQKFDVTVFKEGEETQNARFVHEGKTEITDFANYTVTEEVVVELVFEPKEGVDPLLYPARSQLLKLVPDAKVMSSLAFNDTSWNGESSKWTSASKNRGDKGESPEGARVLKSVWSAQLLDLSSYAEAESEELSVYLYEAENVDIISAPPADGVVQAGGVLKSPQFSVGDSTRSEFRITGESAFAIFEFRTPDDEGENVVGKKLYVKVELALAPSTFKKVDALSDLIAGDSPGDGSEATPYVFGVTKDRGVELSALTENSVGVLAFAVKEASGADFTTLTGSALSVNRGVLARGDLAAGSWLLRISDSGSIKYEPQDLYFQLTFPLGSSSLELANVYEGDRDGSEGSPVEVTVLPSGITLSSLTTPASTGKSLSYEVVAAGSGLAAGTLISNASLKIGDTVGTLTVTRGSFVLKVFEETDDYIEAKDLYFNLIFETASTELKPSIVYAGQSDNGSESDPVVVSEIAQDKSLTLANLIAPYDGTVTYALSRDGVSESALENGVTSLSIGQDPIDHVGPWTIKVSGTPPGGTETEILYFQVTFVKTQMSKAASTANVNIGTQNGADSNTNAIQVRNIDSENNIVVFASGDTLDLSALVTNFSHANNVSYKVGNDAITGGSVTSYEISNGADISLTITDSATSSTTHTQKTLHFKIIVARTQMGKASSATVNIGTQSGADSNTNAIQVRNISSGNNVAFASGNTLNLSALVTNFSDVDNVSYKVGNDAITGGSVTSYEISNGADISLTITDSATSSTTHTQKTLHFKIIVARTQMSKASSTTVNIGTQSGTDSNANAIQVRNISSGNNVAFASGNTLNLASLVTNFSSVSNVSYKVGNDAITGGSITSYEISNGADISLTIADSADSSTTHTQKTLHFKIIVERQASTFALVGTLPDDRTATGNGESFTTPFVISGTFTANTAVNLKTLVDETSAAGTLTYTSLASASDTGTAISNAAAALNDQAGKSVVVKVVDSGSETVESETIFLQLTFAKAASSFALVGTLPDDRTATGNGESFTTPFVISGTFTANTAVNLKTLVDETSAAGTLTYTSLASASDTGTAISDAAAAFNDQAGKSVVVRVVDSGSATVESKTIFLQLTFAKAASSFALVGTLPDSRTATGNGESFATPFVISGTFTANTAVNLKTLVDETSAVGTLTYTSLASASDTGTLITDAAAALNDQAGRSVVVRVVDSGSATIESKTIFLQLTFAASSLSLLGTLPNDRTATGNGESFATPFVISGTFTANTAVNLKTLVDETSAAGTLTYTSLTSASDTGTAISNAAAALNDQAGSSVVVRVVDSGSATVESKTIFLQLTFAKAASSFALVGTLPDSRTATGNGESFATPFVISGTFTANTAVNLKTLVDETSAAGTLTYTSLASASDTGTAISNAAAALNDQAGKSVVVRVVDSGSATLESKTIFLQLTFAKVASSFALVGTFPDSRTATGSGESFATPFVISGTFTGNTAVNLKTLVDETSAAGTLTYTSLTSASDTGTAINDAAAALNDQAGRSVVVKVVDSGSATVESKTIFLQLTFAKAASSFALVGTLPDSRTATGNGESFATPFVISGTFTGNTAVNLKTLVDETSAAGTLTYTSLASASDTGTAISDAAAALNDQAGQSVVVRVVDSGSATLESKTIFLQLTFAKAASAFALVGTLPDSRTATGNGESFTTPFVISGTFTANTAVNLKTLVDETSAAGTLTYTSLASASDTGTSITNPVSALGDKTGESVVVRVVDSGSPTVAGKTLHLNLAFATVLPSADNRYTAAFPSGTGRTNGPEVALTGSMTAGEISFSVELLPNTTQVIYSTLQAGLEFRYEYRDVDGNDNRDLTLYSSQDGLDYILKNNLPAGVYNFTLVKSLSDNGYTVALSVTDSDDTPIVFDSNSLTNDNTIEITNNNVQAFTNPVIGADVRDDVSRRPVRAVNNVRWMFQPSAPQVSLKGGSDFSSLTAGASVGSTFFVRVPNLVAGDTLELFFVVSAQTLLSSLETKTVAAGATSLEFVVTGLTHGTSYEFLVKKPASSSANLLDSPRSVAVTFNTSVPQTTASFIGLSSVEQNGRANLQGLSMTPVNEATDVFAIGDQIFLYEINASNERVAVGNATGLAHQFTTANFPRYSDPNVNPFFPTLNLDLRTANFEERTYNLVVEVITSLGNKADADFIIGPGVADTVFSVTLDSTSPQLSFNFTDLTTLVISVDETLAEGAATAIQNGLTFTGTNANPTVSTVTDNSGSYTVSLSSALTTGALLNLAAGTVADVAGNGNVGVQQSVLPSLRSIVASSNRISGDSSSTTLTFNFAQKIDAATFSVADDLEIIDADGTILTSNLLTLDGVSPASGSSQAVTVTLTADSGFDAQVRVRMKASNEVSLLGSSLTATVTGESQLLDIDLKAPTPIVSFATTEVGLSTDIEFTLIFDEAVTGTFEATDFQVGTAANLADATAAILSNISRKDETTFTGTLTTPDTETALYSLILKANAVTDAYANANSASNAATINVVSTAVPMPSFSAAPLPRHGGSTTLTLSFPEAVTGFDASDLIVTDANSATSTVLLGTLSQTANDYEVTLTTQNTAEHTWTSGDVTVSIAPNAYQNALNQGSSPALSYTVPVSSELTAPALVSVTDGTTTVTSSADLQTLSLSGISVNVNVSAVAGDTLDLFLGANPVAVATQTITTTGTQSLTLSDTSSKVNGSRSAYSARLRDTQANISESSSLFFVTFEDNTAATPPEITGPVSNVSFADDFSSSATSWDFRSGRATGLGQPSTLPGSAEINSDGVLQLNDARNWQYALATQNDLIFSTQGRVVFEGTFIFGNLWDPGDGIAFFAYDARDELFYGDRGYSGNGDLVVTNGRLRSLFFAMGMNEYGIDSIRYAAPGTTPADLSDLGNPTAGNTSAWDIVRLAEIWSNARHRLRITTENRSVVVEYANVDASGVVDKNSWREIFNRSFTSEAYVPDNIKIGFSSATGGAFNYHAIDDVSVDAQLFVPYQINSDPVQAAPRGVALTAGEQANNDPLAIAGIRVEISSGYQAADNLVFSGNSALFSPTLAGNTLIVRAVTGETPTTAEFLAALNDIEFSAVVTGVRTLNWEVFAEDSGSEIRSQSYNSEIRVFAAS